LKAYNTELNVLNATIETCFQQTQSVEDSEKKFESCMEENISVLSAEALSAVRKVSVLINEGEEFSK
jgi:hypothetical protein